jgi:hypothetical protein
VLVAIAKHHGTQNGELTAEKAGAFYLVWDNTYSILKGKTIEYQVGSALLDWHHERRPR